MRPIILDCDGVLLDWEKGFREWMGRRFELILDAKGPSSWDMTDWTGLSHEENVERIKLFARTPMFGHLPAFREAPRVVGLLRERGHPLFVLTSCDSKASAARKANLMHWFGNAFTNVICLDLGKSKRDWLKKFAEVVGPCIWVEDNMKNALDGVLAGHRAFLVKQRHNHLHHEGPEPVIRLDRFQDILSHIK